MKSKFFRVVLLPLGLCLGTVLGLGSFYETSDDQHFAFLFQGVTAAAPVPALPLYFQGLSHGLAAGYAAFPAGPWYGLLLAALLAVATVLVFAVLDKLLRPRLRPEVVVGVLLVFFLLAWLEHWLWFSHLRVAMLLAGSAVLFAAQRAESKKALALSTGLMLLAWAIRPGAAVIALVPLALPAAVLLAGSLRRAAPAVLAAALVLGLASGLATGLETPATARYRALDRQLAAVLDYHLLRPAPRTPADSLTAAAVPLWLFGDESIVNEAACRRVFMPTDAPAVSRALLAKLAVRLGLLARDYFPVLLLPWPSRPGWALGEMGCRAAVCSRSWALGCCCSRFGTLAEAAAAPGFALARLLAAD
jgi:hypothetical protein